MRALIYLDRVWLVVGPFGHIRLSTVITFSAVFGFVAWKLRSKGKAAFYHGAIAAAATFGLYEALFNLTGRYPPMGPLPIWASAALLGSMLLGLHQAKNHFVLGKMPKMLFSAFTIAWLIWILVGFPFNLPSSHPLNLVGEALNVSTKFLLPFGYATGLQDRK